MNTDKGNKDRRKERDTDTHGRTRTKRFSDPCLSVFIRVPFFFIFFICVICGVSLSAQVKDARTEQREYAGPGREDPEPQGIREVPIGYFGPSEATNPDSDLYRAARLAVEEANRAGGYKGKPFRLVPGWAENPWAAGAPIVARMVFQDKVWAIIGGPDGPSTHLAEQVVAKALVPLISPVSTDKTVNYAGIPWMFSCMPSDEQWAPVLSEAILNVKGRIVLISANDHDSHLAAEELLKHLALRGTTPLYSLEFKPGETDLAGLIEPAATSQAKAFVIQAPPVDAARVVLALRQKRPDAKIFGGPSFARPAFATQAGLAGSGLSFPSLCNVPDCAVQQTYDATRLVIAAIQKAGLNRARIRDEIEKLSPWRGVAGTIEFDKVGQNQRAVRIDD